LNGSYRVTNLFSPSYFERSQPMRLPKNLFVALIVSTFVCGTAMAQPPEREGARRRGAGGPGGPGGASGFMRMLPVMIALDANQDGQLSSKEIKNATAALMKLDKNKDGQLTMDELRPEFNRDGGSPRGGRPGGPQGQAGRPQGQGGRPQGQGGRPQGQGGRGDFMLRMFEQRDANKDGKLSGDEIPAQMADRMERIDADGDKAISKAEMEKAMSRMSGRPGGAGRPGGRQGGGQPGGDRPARPQVEEE
jgi:hypothetical protein